MFAAKLSALINCGHTGLLSNGEEEEYNNQISVTSKLLLVAACNINQCLNCTGNLLHILPKYSPFYESTKVLIS